MSTSLSPASGYRGSRSQALGQVPYIAGEVEEGPRSAFFHFSDRGDLLNLSYNRWKIVFAEQLAHSSDVREEPFVALRLPKFFDLYFDPFEIADHESSEIAGWRFRRLLVPGPAQAQVAGFLSTFLECLPRQKHGSFTIDAALEALQGGVAASNPERSMNGQAAGPLGCAT